jgi:outer membrane protein
LKSVFLRKDAFSFIFARLKNKKMNKNLSIGLNIVLFAAVAVLYYLHFTQSNSSAAENTINDSLTSSKPIVLAPKDIKASKTVYVNLDVLNEKYQFIQDLSASAQAEQRALESKYQTKGQKLQEDYTAFQQKAQQGLLSDNQISTEQEAFAKRKEELDLLEQQSQSLVDKIQQRNEEANANLRKYIKEYNKNSHYNYVFAYSSSPLSQVLLADDSLDITNEILEGLNNQYKTLKTSEKKK